MINIVMSFFFCLVRSRVVEIEFLYKLVDGIEFKFYCFDFLVFLLILVLVGCFCVFYFYGGGFVFGLVIFFRKDIICYVVEIRLIFYVFVYWFFFEVFFLKLLEDVYVVLEFFCDNV